MGLDAAQTSDDGLDYPFRLIGISHLNRDNTRFLGRIVIPARKQSVPDENHFLNGNAKGVAQFSNPVGFVYAGFGDINRGCAA